MALYSFNLTGEGKFLSLLGRVFLRACMLRGSWGKTESRISKSWWYWNIKSGKKITPIYACLACLWSAIIHNRNFISHMLLLHFATGSTWLHKVAVRPHFVSPLVEENWENNSKVLVSYRYLYIDIYIS